MAGFRIGWGSTLLVLGLLLVVLPGKAAAFGAGNIPSIAQVEGHNWRHGDIEDLLKTIAFLHGKKWTTMMVGRVYFGNWLRDYSQAIDVGSLKGVNAATIRIIVWVLSFMANGYATEEFEVTEERLGTYRPEEHIDNPLGYADGEDARKYDPRLRGPVDPRELEIDPSTGMKNYIANERGGWATSAGYLRFSFARSIHFGRVYTSGGQGTSGKEADLCEGLRCLGQALHCMEDWGAHSNYCELALIELGHHNVFTHCGSSTQINLRGKTVYPIVTGTFGAVDFLHSVLGEATDHFTQSEVDEIDIALKSAEQATRGNSGGYSGQRGFFGSGSGGGSDFISLVSQLPGVGDGYASQARSLQAMSAAQEQENTRASSGTNTNIVPGMSPNFDPVKVSGQIYPILAFRDKIVRSINNMISKIPGLESLLEHISETLTAFVLGLLAPFIRPIINQVSKALKEGSSGLIETSAKAQFEPWTNPHCDNPTHSMLSKDHFTNILNSCGGRVAGTILQYVVPRVLYAWENPGVPVDEVVDDVLRAFHHPAIRDENIEIHRNMFETVRKWSQETPHRHNLDQLLSSDSVKNHKNHVLASDSRGGSRSVGPGGGCDHGNGGHGRPAGSLWSQIKTTDREMRENASPSAAAPSHAPLHGQAGGYYSGSSPQPHARPTSSGYAGSYGQPTPPLAQQPGYGAQGGGYPGQGAYSQHQHQQPPPPQAGHWQGPGQGYPPQQPPYGGGGPPHQQYGAYSAPQQPQYPPQGGQPPWGGYQRY
ncbi:heterokaryon incompatibility Het-C [Trichocladium antarcticum]|uniref:Heterokaryon incompatibility Het-C n=1 Tax=Trichocladium antarcticum TaxID=1450529 RepID=A0AAN6UC89_9PEZI|nr:heterokaryon incompatibility Het-C [Trichocladium antarcticum]